MDQLPLELVMTIFSKAPLETLIQCRRVCKSWRAALSDPSRLKIHSIKLPRCLVIHGNPNDTSNLNSRFIYLYDQRTIPSHDNAILKLTTKTKDPKSVTTELVGSCNGLLCWCRKEPAGEKDLFHFTLYVSNPLTGELMEITGGTDYIGEKLAYRPYHKSEVQFKIGFGYSPKKKQHKIVYLSEKIKGDMYEAKVLTLTNTSQGKKKWKCVQCPYRIHPRFGLYSNGALHWIAYELDPFIPDKICSFDLDTEQFMLLPSPTSVRVHGIAVINDWLTFWSDYSHEIWMMTQYGVESSWVELKTRGFSRRRRIYHNEAKPDFNRPLVIYPKKKILVLHSRYHRKELHVYDHKLERDPMVDLQFPDFNEVIPGFDPTFLSMDDVFKGYAN